jgi:arylformamidase
MRGKRIVDLSHIMIPGKEEYGLALETLETAAVYPQYKVREDTWYILQNIAMGSHCGTHIEFPYHHNSQGFDAATFPFDRLVGPCVLLDFQHKQANEPVTLEELQAYDELIQVGDGVLFNFDCAKKYGTPLGHERPFLEYEATEWLVHQKRINVLGSDASGVEIKGAVGQPIHELVMKHQIPIIEFAANLNALQARRFTLLTLAMPIRGLDASPLRLVAIEDLD